MALLDIYDENLNPNGTATFEETHKNRLWRIVFHNWVTRPDNKIIVQKRSNDHPHNPGAICVSAAGHAQIGETIEDSPRETKEEIGLNFQYNEISYIGNVHFPKVREIVHVHFANDDTPLKQYRLQKKEVGGIYEMGINEGIAFFNGISPTVKLEGYKRTESGYLVPETINARREDFSTGSEKPWLWMFEKAKKYINGDYEKYAPEVDIKNPLEIF